MMIPDIWNPNAPALVGREFGPLRIRPRISQREVLASWIEVAIRSVVECTLEHQHGRSCVAANVELGVE